MSIPTKPSPLALSDQQLDTVMRAAAPLLPGDRDNFLRALAARLHGECELGDGVIFRACRELQREFFRPPTATEPQGPRLTAKLREAKPIWASAQK